ncbi:uncharacterized protein HaLaN_00127 [Haematococcus lacustris]|uniref:BBS7 beta-propeller domain-containing protein n=1 Tax=Haematococcus lacustris TaxID=44745 RepID=A0A699YCQ1_HAELA|nr:uncharacterized protein HaLaN_00127 [Haematococcus lacustris]
MELELFRHDVMQTGTCGRGTMAILPMEEKKTQKVALGDYNGVIQAFSVKKGEIASSFKTLPTPQQKVMHNPVPGWGCRTLHNQTYRAAAA